MNITRLVIVVSALVVGPSYLLADESTDNYEVINDLLVREAGGGMDIMATAGNYLQPLPHGHDYFEASDVEIYGQVSKAQRRA